MDNSHFSYRSCYINFAEHLQNAWNVNMLFPEGPNKWDIGYWKKYFIMIKEFGFNIFEFWLSPTMFSPEAIEGNPLQIKFKNEMRDIIDTAHEIGLKVKAIIPLNTIGQKWFFACPNISKDRELILSLWGFWTKELNNLDIVGIFPGDPGGCNRHGCNYETYINMCLSITELSKKNIPNARIAIGTWGTPFSGWDEDSFPMNNDIDNWVKMEEAYKVSGYPCPIWNGKIGRAEKAMEYFIKILPKFPKDTLVEINIGLSPNSTNIYGGPAKKWAREIAKIRDIITWDYALAEGELISYPHWRIPNMSTKIREWRAAAPYAGGMTYTMSPKLSILTQYASAKLLINPDECPDKISKDFCAKVFGKENDILGELFEAFEIVDGWGHFPRHTWSREALRKTFDEIIERLEACKISNCNLPIPDPEEYKEDILWFARKFRELSSENPDREKIKKDYWKKALKIYDFIPMSEDKRADIAAEYFSKIGENLV